MTGAELEVAAVLLAGVHRHAGPYRHGATRYIHERLTPRINIGTLQRWLARPEKPIPRWAERQVTALLAAREKENEQL